MSEQAQPEQSGSRRLTEDKRSIKGDSPHSGMQIRVGEGGHEWEMAKDEELDHMTAEQLVYLYHAIEVTLQDRGAIHSDGVWWIP